MGLPVLILGESGSGKSTSLRNYENGEVAVFNVASKRLPFRKKLSVANTSSYEVIKNRIKAVKPDDKLKTFVIDDSQYLMAFESFENAKVTGYGKFTDMAVNFYNLIKTIKEADDNTIVFLLHHSELKDDGKLKAKTIGKMLDSQLSVDGLFEIILLAEKDCDGYHFLTRSDGMSTVKSPLEMFTDEKIPNDLKMVEKTIREYYGMNEGE